MTNESTVRDKRLTFQNDTDIKRSGGAAIVDDARFGKCAQLPGPGAGITLRPNCSELGLHGENFTLSLWVRRDADEDALLFLGTDVAKWQIGAKRVKLIVTKRVEVISAKRVDSHSPEDDQQNIDFPYAEFAIDKWHHLAWTKAGDTHRFYLDGAFVEEKKADWSWRAEDILTLNGQGVCWVADLKCYARKLSDAEVRVDYIAERPTAAETFTEQYPMDFAIANVEDGPYRNYPDNKFFIVDSADKVRVRQKILLTNASGRAIVLKPTGNTTVASDNHHFELRFRNATFSEPNIYPQFTSPESTPDKWSISGSPQQNREDGTWSIFILSKEEQSLPIHKEDASARFEFPFEYVTADAALGARGTSVALYYRNLAYGGDKAEPVSGARNKQVDILGNQPSYFPLVLFHDAPGGVVCNDSNTTLHFVLHNRSDETIAFTENAGIRFILPKGDDIGDLIKNDDSAGSGADSLHKTNPSMDSSVFLWKPDAEEKIAARTAKRFRIQNCTPNDQPGMAIIDMEYEGIKGHSDGRLAIGIVKTTRDLAKLAGGENVGIGTDTPVEKLDVDGDMHVRGNADSGASKPQYNLHIEGGGQISLIQNGSIATNSTAGIYWAEENEANKDRKDSKYAIYRTSGAWNSPDFQQLKIHWPTGIILQPGIGDSAGYGKSHVEITGGNGLRVTHGDVAIGTKAPEAKLDVNGDSHVSGDIRVEGNVGIGTSNPRAKLQVTGGAIMPAEGNSEEAGILFPDDPGGGAGDRAWMRYYARSGESMTLEVGVSNDPDDHIALMPSGNVGVGTNAPEAKLDVRGLIRAEDLKLNSANVETGKWGGYDLLLINRTTGELGRRTQPGSMVVDGDLGLGSGGKFKIGSTEITENDLRILKQLASSDLKVQIKSGPGRYLDNYGGRCNNGDSDRTIQFRDGSSVDTYTTMTLKII